LVARALETAGVSGFDVVLESVGGSVLASVLGGLAVGGRVRIQHPQPRQEGSAESAQLIQGVLGLIEDGLHLPAPAVVDWTEAIDAHIAQSQGRSRGKTVVRL
jgi:NADPH:quinone reductase-like Zn-dependent oxidoreductase